MEGLFLLMHHSEALQDVYRTDFEVTLPLKYDWLGLSHQHLHCCLKQSNIGVSSRVRWVGCPSSSEGHEAVNTNTSTTYPEGHGKAGNASIAP
jgi:hypothetical protein